MPVKPIQDTNEVIGFQWFTPTEIRAMLAHNEIRNGGTLTGLGWAIARGYL